jgi:osmotically-inducible protein OsmY
MLSREEAEIKGKIVMQTSELSERAEATILEPVPSDDELENRTRSLLRWKIRFNAVDVAVESGHVTLSGQVMSALDRETAEQTIRKLRGVVGVTNCIIASPTGPGLC